jgi:hypothetical protein
MAYQEVKDQGAEADHVRSSAEVKNAGSYKGRSLTHELWEGVANSVPLPLLQGLACERGQGLHLTESRTRNRR